MPKAVIRGTGIFAPERLIENSYFDKFYDKELSGFLEEKRNIRQRYFMTDDQATSDLILPAAEQAIKQAGIEAKDIDLLIVATDTPDYVSPATSAVVQHRLGAKNAGTFDLNCACAGFVTALDVANKYIVSDKSYQNILVVGAYGMSRFFDWDDYKVTSVFADGAGAVILQASEEEDLGIHASELYTDGQYHDAMGIYAGGTRQPMSHQMIEERNHLLKFVKRIPVETNRIHWPRMTHNLLERIKKTPDQISHFFLTQLNIETIERALSDLGQPSEKSHNIMDRYGYTGSACIPMALADATSQGKLKKGDLLLLIGSGGGMAMASMALTWGYDT